MTIRASDVEEGSYPENDLLNIEWLTIFHELGVRDHHLSPTRSCLIRSIYSHFSLIFASSISPTCLLRRSIKKGFKRLPDYALPSVTKRLVAGQGFCGIS